MSDPPIQRALISVSNKEGIIDFASALIQNGVEILSTGGTRKHLQDAGLEVRDLSEYTEFPEMMDGRLKTLHPRVHGGILCRHDQPQEMELIAEHGILAIPLVVVNLYPFEETIAKRDVTLELAIENIDIGGPTMIRAAAKNYRFTTVCTSPAQHQSIIRQIEESHSTQLPLRKQLALDAFAMTARYDRAISQFLSEKQFSASNSETIPADANQPPESFRQSLVRKASLRYGENPHQEAALYEAEKSQSDDLIAAEQLNGKELSYNNLLDLESALQLVKLLPDPSAVVIKHNNPCGASSQSSLRKAVEFAFEGDPESAFGSVLGFNSELDLETAEFLVEPGKFVEAIIAPDFTPAAIEVLTTRPKWKNNVRLMKTGPLTRGSSRFEMRSISGGLLVQNSDTLLGDPSQWQVVTDISPTDSQREDLHFVWMIVRQIKSNAIAIGKETSLWGSGAGQMSRVDAVNLALQKSGDKASGCVLASDAFFPFPDSIERAAAAGIKAIIQPGGSRKDEEVIAACNQHKLPMIFTGQRHFKH